MAAAGFFLERTFPSFDGLQLYVRDYPGPRDSKFTVVCIPGLTRNSRDFDAFAPHLSQHYRVLCVDLRGRGKSQYAPDPMSYQPPTYVRDMLSLFKAFALNRVVLVGTSLGGIISTVLGAVTPTKVLGIVMNDIGPEVDATGLTRIAAFVARGYQGPSWDAAAEALHQVDGKIYPSYTHDDWLRMAKRRFKDAPGGGVMQDYDLNLAKPFGDAAKATSAATSLWPYFLRLQGIPVLALRGAISDVLSPETFAKMKQRLAHLQQCTVPERGHTPYLDEPESMAAIDQFLASLPSQLTPREWLTRAARQVEFLIRLKLGALPS
jgi:pimeloyl-ACP methyl ester carboxylesterase